MVSLSVPFLNLSAAWGGKRLQSPRNRRYIVCGPPTTFCKASTGEVSSRVECAHFARESAAAEVRRDRQRARQLRHWAAQSVTSAHRFFVVMGTRLLGKTCSQWGRRILEPSRSINISAALSVGVYSASRRYHAIVFIFACWLFYRCLWQSGRREKSSSHSDNSGICLLLSELMISRLMSQTEKKYKWLGAELWLQT